MNKITLPQTDTMIELHVPDFKVVKDFYGKLGYKVVWETEPGAIGYMVLKRNNSILAFYSGTEEVYNHRFFKRFPKESPRGYAVEIVVYIEDLPMDEFYEDFIKNLGDKYVVEPLILERWGKKDFRIMDPFGFYIRFSEPDNILLPE